MWVGLQKKYYVSPTGILNTCSQASPCTIQAAGMNFHKLLRCIAAFSRFIVDRIYDILQPYLLAEDAQI